MKIMKSLRLVSKFSYFLLQHIMLCHKLLRVIEVLRSVMNFMSFVVVWAEQGDEISLEYAGTNALKGDLVR